MADQLITIASYPQSLLAHAAQNVLAEHGIRAFIADEDTAGLNYWAVDTGTKLQVAAAGAEQALRCLSGFEKGSNQSRGLGDPGPAGC